MLDDKNVLAQKDPNNSLDTINNQWSQCLFSAEINNANHNNKKNIDNIIIAGMGGSALAANLVKTWLVDVIDVPFEIVRNYTLPAYVNENTLVIVSSYSGNTEEAISCFDMAIKKKAQIASLSSGGLVFEKSKELDIANVKIPSGYQPRICTIFSLRALMSILVHFNIVSKDYFDAINDSSDWLKEESSAWHLDIPTHDNYAKQLALLAVGKIGMFYSSRLMSSVAYKWKISWHENSNNLAYMNTIPEFNHNELISWTGKPVEKPFAIFNIKSSFDNERIKKRFDIAETMLSGQRPKTYEINLRGDSVIRQMLWGCILADYTSAYLAILNSVNPESVDFLEEFKQKMKSI